MILLDSLATRYHLLPSQVLQQADTLDIMVMDVAHGYDRYLRERNSAQAAGQPPPAPPLSVNKMQEMIQRVKGKQ